MKIRKLRKEILILMCIFAGTAVVLTIYLIATGNQKQPVSEIPTSTMSVISEERPASLYFVTNEEISSAGGIEVIHSYIPWGSPRRPGEVREIRYITVHETDNRSSGADAAAHNSLLVNNTTDSTGWHYTVDDHSIYHNIPDNEISWNAGDNRTKYGGNMNGIGIEICVNLSNDYEQSLRNAAALIGKLLVTYDLHPKDARFHQDFMDKVCPHRLITEGRTEWFEGMIEGAYYDCLKQKIKDTVNREYRSNE